MSKRGGEGQDVQCDEAGFEVLFQEDALVVLGPFCTLLRCVDLQGGAIGDPGKEVEECPDCEGGGDFGVSPGFPFGGRRGGLTEFCGLGLCEVHDEVPGLGEDVAEGAGVALTAVQFCEFDNGLLLLAQQLVLLRTCSGDN